MAVLVISLPIIFAEEYSLLYDANGNLVYDQETNVYREYNELNQLIRTRQNNASGTILQEYVWDPLKEEIFIKDEFYTNGSLKSSTYYFGMDYIVIQNSSGTYNRTNIYQDGILVGYEDFDGRKRYVLPDHKGSAHIILNESGDVIEENLFSPFAEPLQGVIENKFSYEAKEYDSLVKDYDFHFRKYDPKLRIFTQPDTLIQNVYDPQSLNRYSFERNNPLGKTDKDGHAYTLFGIFIVLFTAIYITLFTNDVASGVLDVAFDTGVDIYTGIKEQKQQEIIEKNADYRDAIMRQADAKTSNISENSNPSSDEKINENRPPQIESIEVQINKEEVVPEEDDGKVKKDKLPDINELVNRINNQEEENKQLDHTSNSYNSGANSGVGCVETCSTSCSSVYGGGQVCFEVCNKC